MDEVVWLQQEIILSIQNSCLQNVNILTIALNC